MTAQDVEQEIDRLYELPLGAFTAARNALAKRIGGAESARIKALDKPQLAAWAVNQLYWRRRKTYDQLVKASERLRAAHRAAIAGRSADVRGVDDAHRAATRDALKEILALLDAAGERATDATRTALLRTLEALPSEEPPGRLARPLEPSGFALLAGVQPAEPSKVLQFRATRKGKGRASLEAQPHGTRERVAKARKAVADAERTLRAARAAAREAETGQRQATKHVDRTREREARARDALEAAEREVREAAAEADRARTAARRAAEEAEAAEAALRRARAQLAAGTE